MSTPITGVPETPELAPQKVGAVPGLTQKIMTALAALGLATSAEKVAGATILPFSNPVLISNSSNISQVSVTGLDLYHRSNATNQTWAGIEGSPYQATSRFSITIPSDSDGVLTISWDSIIGTGIAPGGTTATWFINTIPNVDQRFRLGLNGWDMNEVAFLDGVGTLNTGSPVMSWTELFNLAKSFSGTDSVTLNVLKGQVYNFDISTEAMNTTAFWQVDNLKFSFEGIPEPSMPVLLSTGIATLLMRRRRRESQEK